MDKHTPTPLAYDESDGRLYIADGDVMPTVAWLDDKTSPELNDEQAAFIVRAVNSHEPMLAVLREIIEANDDYLAHNRHGDPDPLTNACAKAKTLMGIIDVLTDPRYPAHRRQGEG